MNVLSISCKKGWAGIVTWVHKCALGLEGRGHKVWLLSHPDSLFNKAEPPGIRLLPKKLGMDFNPFMIGWLAAFIRSNKVDVVITNIKKEVVAGGIAARLSGIANVRMIGLPDDLNPACRWYQQKLVDHSIVPADDTLHQAMKRSGWLRPEDFTTVYIGRDPVTYSPEEIADVRRRWGLSADHLVLGCTARLAEQKNPSAVLRVFREVVEEFPECRLVLTGDGPERKQLESLTEQLGLSDHVVLPGFSKDPMRATAAYDIALLNSWTEGLPNTIMEYFALGKAVICTRVGGIPEVVDDGRNGLLVSPGDDRALLDRIKMLIRDRAMRTRLGEQALATLRQRFADDMMVKAYEGVLEQAVAGKRS